MRYLRVVALAGLLLAAVRPVSAQVAFNVAGLYASLSGNDFQGTNAGIGGDGQVRFRLAPSPITLGIGGQYTTHSVDGIDPNFNVWGVFVEPRYAFPSGASQIKPYIAARGGYVHQSISDQSNTLSADGFEVGAGGGILIGLGGVDLDIGFLFALVNFGEQKLNGSGTGFSPSGNAVALRAGLQFGGK